MMTSRLRWASALLFICLAQPVLAADEPFVDKALLAAICSERGTMNYDWGERNVRYAQEFRALHKPPLTLPAKPMGFSLGQAYSTDWSDQLFQFALTAENISPDAANAFAEFLNDTLQEQGWRYIAPVPGETLKSSFLELGAAWKRTVPVSPASDKTADLTMDLSRFAGNLVLGCSRDDLMQTQIDEALFGRLPEGTPRPLPPDIGMPQALSPTRCANIHLDMELQQIVGSASSLPLLDAAMAQSRYASRLTTWKRWKLESSGKVPDSEIDPIIFGSSDTFLSSLLALQSFGKLSPLFDRMQMAKSAEDTVAMCNVLVEVETLFTDIIHERSEMTAGIEQDLDALSVKYGVSLDQD